LEKPQSVSPVVVVKVYLSKKPKSISESRGNCFLSLGFAPFYYLKRPCPLSLRGIFYERYPLTLSGEMEESFYISVNQWQLFEERGVVG